MNYQDVFAHFSFRFTDIATVVVAGGAVRDEHLGQVPKDYDVFLLNTGYSDQDRARVKAEIDDLPTLDQLHFHKSEPYLVETVRLGSAIVQVMCTPCQTVGELLDTFDWNVSLFAYDGALHQRCSREDIEAGKPLVLQKVTYPMSTLRRGFRFSERFGMEFKKDDVVALCRQVVARADEVTAAVAAESEIAL